MEVGSPRLAVLILERHGLWKKGPEVSDGLTDGLPGAADGLETRVYDAYAEPGTRAAYKNTWIVDVWVISPPTRIVHFC